MYSSVYAFPVAQRGGPEFPDEKKPQTSQEMLDLANPVDKQGRTFQFSIGGTGATSYEFGIRQVKQLVEKFEIEQTKLIRDKSLGGDEAHTKNFEIVSTDLKEDSKVLMAQFASCLGYLRVKKSEPIQQVSEFRPNSVLISESTLTQNLTPTRPCIFSIRQTQLNRAIRERVPRSSVEYSQSWVITGARNPAN